MNDVWYLLKSMLRGKVERQYNPAEYDIRFESIPINRRQCIAFIPKNPKGKLCHCNRFEEEHPKNTYKRCENETWNRNIHTIKDPTKEQGVSVTYGIPYIRCDIETDPSIVEKILLNVWDIPRPSLLMQITGGHKYFKLRGKLELNFLDNLVKFLSKSNTWLLTNGANVGIVQLIGQSIRKRKSAKPKDKVVAIGVCNYGTVKNLHDFQRPEHTEIRSNFNSHRNQHQKNIDQSQSGEQNLEMNHTHFILLDDGTLHYYNIGDYRTRLIKAIANRNSPKALPVPQVTILFEGGEDSIRSIYYDLRNNIPIVIISNTGRMADYFVRWLSRTQEMDMDVNWRVSNDINDRNDAHTNNSQYETNSVNANNVESNDLNQHRLRKKFDKYFDSMYDELVQSINGIDVYHSSKILNLKKVKAEMMLMVLYCLQPKVRTKINIYNFNKGHVLSEIILRSICTSFEIDNNEREIPNLNCSNEFLSHIDYLLELALDWDCINTAKEWIVQDSIENIHDKKRIFLRALTKQRHKFAHYFIHLGFEIDEIFFDPTTNPFASRNNENSKRYNEFLSILYTEEAINRDDWLLRDFVRKTNKQERKVIRSTKGLNELFQSLIGSYMKPLYYDTQIEEENDRMGVKRFTNLIYPAQDVEQGQLMSSDNAYRQLAKDYIMRDLFLWSIVMNYIDLAKVFLSHMKDRICGALIATEILSHLRDTSSDAVHGDKKEELTYWINYFEQYAIDCIDLCFKNDPNMAQLLTIQRVEMFGDVTCLQIASDANCKRFASHPCCRQAENSIWYDKLHCDQFHIKYYIGQLIGSWTLGLLAPLTARFRTVKEPLPTEPILQSYGINYCDPYGINHFNGIIREKLYQIWQFHQSLHIKYTYHHVQYITFLFLFSYVLLFNFEPFTNEKKIIHPTEILVIIAVTCMFIEEIRIFFNQDSLSFTGKFYNYFRDFFKQLCLASFLLFYIGLAIRFQTFKDSQPFQIARIFMGIDLWIWWIRSLSFIIVNPYLGPHLVSIGKMLKNLSFFAILIAIVMTAYGVASRSMAMHGTFEFSIKNVLRSILYPVYYLLYTNVSDELGHLDESIDDISGFVTHILLAFHMLLINVLLVNLLIAMFNQSFQDVQSVQSDIWNYQQYGVVREYYDRPPLFIPFSTIFDIITLIKLSYQWYLRVKYNYINPLDRVFQVIAVRPELESEWQEFEYASTYAYAQSEALTKKKKITLENDLSQREMNVNNVKSNENMDVTTKNSREKDAITQLRNELKLAVRDLRNEIRLINKQNN